MTELKIKKESKESLFGGRLLNVTVQRERRGEGVTEWEE